MDGLSSAETYGPAVFRRADLSDARRLADLHIRMLLLSYRGTDPTEWAEDLRQQLIERESLWQERLSRRPDDIVHVAEVSPAGLVGFALGGAAREPNLGYGGELTSLYLLPEHRRRGIGRELLRRLARSLLQGGFRGMMVRVLSADPTRVFYEKLGARVVGTRIVMLGERDLEETVYGWSDTELFFPP
jgi:GNAT superfamily N-acetyltransferase